ncbi:MAG: cupin domain-containing protein [Methylophilaceae bacterium]
MSTIVIDHHPDEARLKELGVSKWPTWSKEVSVFPWVFPEQEIAYILEGEVVITPDGGGAPVTFAKGDLVTFPAGMACTWDVRKPLHKHYHLDGTLIGRIARRIKLFLKF